MIRKKVRDALKNILADSSTGFNARLASIAVDYGITPFTIDWIPGSRQFFFGYLDAAQVDLSQLELQGISCSIYTTDAENQHRQKPGIFSGPLIGVIQFYLFDRHGTAVSGIDDLESISDAIEHAVLMCIEDSSAAWPPGVVFTGRYRGNFGPVEMTGDGWQRVLPMEFEFEVHT